MGRNNIKHKWKRLDQRSLGFLSKEINGVGVQNIDSPSADVQRDICLATKNQFSELNSEDFEEEHCDVQASEPPRIIYSASHRLTKKASVDLNSVSQGVAAGYSSVPSSIRPIRDSSLPNQVSKASKIVKSKSQTCADLVNIARSDAVLVNSDAFQVNRCGSGRLRGSVADVDSEAGRSFRPCMQRDSDAGALLKLDASDGSSDAVSDPDYFPSEHGKSVSTSLSDSEGVNNELTLEASLQQVESSEIFISKNSNLQGRDDFVHLPSINDKEKGINVAHPLHVCENEYSDFGWDLRKGMFPASSSSAGDSMEPTGTGCLHNNNQQVLGKAMRIGLNVTKSAEFEANSGENLPNLGSTDDFSQRNFGKNDMPIANGNQMPNIGDKKLGEATMVKSWKSLFYENRKVNLGLSLQKFTSSMDFVELTEDDFEHNKNYEWNFCLVGYFSGKFPGFNALKNLVALTWKVNVSIHRHDSGWIIFKFNCMEDMDGVIQNGPYAIYGRSLILKIMPKYFSFDSKELSCFPVWLQVKNVPLCAWSPIPLGKILSFIGKPLCTDKVTATRERVSFVRALVEVDMDHDLPLKVDVKLPDNHMHSFPIVYENLPFFCNYCKRMGHVISNCAKVPKQDVSELKNGQESGGNASIEVENIDPVHGRISETVREAKSRLKRAVLNGSVAGNSEAQGFENVQENSVLMRTQNDGIQGSSSNVQGLSTMEESMDLGAVLVGGLSTKGAVPLASGSNEKLAKSDESSQGLAVKSSRKSGFELKKRVLTSPNGVGIQKALMKRFVHIIERADSMPLLENWVTYMEECMVPLEAG